jgi:cholesterol oxidase
MDADVIVIGSGFGGSVSACRMAEKGKKVIVLERGRRWTTEDYPSVSMKGWFWSETLPQRHNGWIDLGIYKDMSVARGAGVGGGSLIYANVSVPAKKEAFQQGWPDEINYDKLARHYQTVGEMLELETLPETQLTDRYRIMELGANKLGYGERFGPVPLAVKFQQDWKPQNEQQVHPEEAVYKANRHGVTQGTCVHCGDCDLGCPYRAKNTLDLNYLAVAEKHGAEIRPLHLVSHIKKIEDGYRVYFHELKNKRKRRGSLDARKVILAAGSMGSTEILLRCKEQYKTLPNLSGRLGHGWSANGDFVTVAIQAEDAPPAYPTRGPTISSAIDLLDGVYKGERLFIEDGGLPGFLGRFLERRRFILRRVRLFRYGAMVRALRHGLRKKNPLKRIMVWFGQGVDASDGQLKLGRAWYAPWHRRIKLGWDIDASLSTMEAMKSLHLELAEATGGTAIVPPTYTFSKDLITPHPLGGCNMGKDIDSGVVDHKGEVFNYPSLYVADGSIIPRAIGLNPSRTIAALAERMMEFID